MTPESLVRAALQRYGLHPHRLRPLAAEVVRVDTTDGRSFALRCRPRSGRTFGDIPLELDWTEALRRETHISPPQPIPGLDGALIQDVAGPEDALPYDCVLFRWIPGPSLADRLTLENVRRLGVLSARLHAHAAGYRPPPDLPVRMLDQFPGRGEREVLFSHPHPYFLPPARRAVFERIAERYRRAVAALYADPTPLRVIHADLHHGNVKLHRDRLRPLDFYEVIWGYPVQDVALTFFDLRYYTDPRLHSFPALREAFASGYGSLLPWPETHPGQLDTLVAGRRLRQANWVLWRETAPFAPDPAEILPYFERVEAEFRSLLDGTL